MRTAVVELPLLLFLVKEDEEAVAKLEILRENRNRDDVVAKKTLVRLLDEERAVFVQLNLIRFRFQQNFRV